MVEVSLKFLMVVLFSGIIGYEREVNRSNAGIKTHVLVGVGATTVALIQLSIMNTAVELNLLVPSAVGAVRSDPARLIAQVVSGIGFLGAGTIIVTKRNISGLTTAASIWTVACIGLAIGMGYYEIGVLSSVFTILTLFTFKRIVKIRAAERIEIKYLQGEATLARIETVFNSLNIDVQQVKFTVSPIGEELIYTNIFELNHPKKMVFHDIVSTMSGMRNIVSIERTNIV